MLFRSLKSKPLKRNIISSGWDSQFKKKSNRYNYTLPDNKPKKLRDIISRDYKNEKRADKR